MQCKECIPIRPDIYAPYYTTTNATCEKLWSTRAEFDCREFTRMIWITQMNAPSNINHHAHRLWSFFCQVMNATCIRASNARIDAHVQFFCKQTTLALARVDHRVLTVFSPWYTSARSTSPTSVTLFALSSWFNCILKWAWQSLNCF